MHLQRLELAFKMVKYLKEKQVKTLEFMYAGCYNVFLSVRYPLRPMTFQCLRYISFNAGFHLIKREKPTGADSLCSCEMFEALPENLSQY